MEWQDIIGLIGGIVGIGSLILLYVNNRLSRKKINSEIGLIDAQRDNESLKFLKGTIEALEERVEKLERQIKELTTENGLVHRLNDIFHKAFKKRPLCPCEICPVEEELNKLKQ